MSFVQEQNPLLPSNPILNLESFVPISRHTSVKGPWRFSLDDIAAISARKGALLSMANPDAWTLLQSTRQFHLLYGDEVELVSYPVENSYMAWDLALVVTSKDNHMVPRTSGFEERHARIAEALVKWRDWLSAQGAVKG